MARDWTNEQREAFETEGGSILVSAAAGSGKTAVLTERVLRKLSEGVSLRELVIMTFTNAAAAELKQRIKKNISERIAVSNDKNFLRKQLLIVNDANISTVHSFCLELIRENYSVLGLPFDVAVGDENDLKIMKGQAAEKIAGEILKNESPEMIDLLSAYEDSSDLPEAIIKLHESVFKTAYPEMWMESVLKLYQNPDFETSVYWREMGEFIIKTAEGHKAIYEDIILSLEADPDLNNAYLPAFLDDFANIKEIISKVQNNDYTGFKTLLSKGFMKLGSSKKGDPETKDEAKDIREAYKADIKKFTEIFDFTTEDYKEDMKIIAPVVSALFGAVNAFEEEYGALKSEKNVIDFCDAEHLAIRLLTETRDGEIVKTQLAKELSENLNEIMVDEFQDTNEAQFVIFSALSKSGENLYMVGDIKQSIYRFRLADPTIFIRQYEKGSKDSFPKNITLKKNFRSTQSVCDLVNEIFSRIMTPYVGEIEYNEDHYLVPNRKINCPTEIALFNESEEEARFVAKKILELKKEGYILGSERVFPDFSDFAVLMRSRKKFSVFSKVFSEYSIPYSADSGSGIFDSRECSLLISLLRVINNPMLDAPMAAVMLSPVFRFTPDDLLRVRKNKKKRIYTELKASEDERIKEFLGIIDEYKLLALTSSVSEIITKIIYETDFSLVLGSAAMGEERMANLLGLLNFSKDFEKSGTVMLPSFLRYIDKCIENKNTLSSSGASSSRAVTFMTVHASKGLEFPVCFVCDTGHGFGYQYCENPFNMHSELGIAMKIRSRERYVEYPSVPLEAMKIRVKRESLSEEMRILYVALTRAKDKLIITGSNNNIENFVIKNRGRKLISENMILKGGSLLQWILWGLKEETEILICPELEETDISEGCVSADKEIIKLLKENENWCYSKKGIEKIPVRLSVSAVSKEGSKNLFSSRPAFSLKSGATAAEKGTANHRFMQFANYYNAHLSVEDELERLKREEFLSLSEIELIDIGRLKAFFSSSLYEKIASSKEVKREYDFMFSVSADRIMETEKGLEDEKVLLQGIADCVIIEEDGFTVIDYKTDRADEEELKKRYSVQLMLYGEALEERLNLKLKDKIIYSFYLGKEIKL